MPTPTNLVTDLPADFEVFGQAVATSMGDLLGGTSGQILSKASNTDMDFTWTDMNPGDITGVTAGTGISGGGTSGTVTITNSMATEITAKGDLIVGTGSATFDNLAAGANGSTLVADSSTSTGLRYQAPVQQNPVLNSAYQVWQRGTSFTNCSSVYTADRWYSFTYGVTTGRTVSRQLTGDTTNLPNIQYCVRIARNNADTNTSAWQFFNPWETLNSVQLAGKTITLSFYARKGANYSATSSILRSLLTYGTGTDQNPINGYTGGADAIDQNNTLTTTWQRFTATATLPATVTEISTNFIWTPTGTAGAADYVEITGVQVEVGSVATPFHTYAATIQGELAACQRYYIRTTSTGTDSNHGIGLANSTVQAYIHANIAEMRVIPTAVDYANLNVSDTVTNYTFSGLSINSANSTPRLAFLIATGITGLTQFRPLFMRNNNNTAGYLGFSAEL